MNNLELTATEARVLYDLLKSTLSDLSVEIAGTDRKDYRDEIKAKRKLVREIFARLEQSVAGA